MIISMSWIEHIPEKLWPAVKHIQGVFDHSDFKCSWITQHLCYADLHPGAPGLMQQDELAQLRSAFLDLRRILGPSIAKQFDLVVASGTPAAIFHGYAEIYRYGLSAAVRVAFSDALQIATGNIALITNEPIGWAQSLVQDRIRNGKHRFSTWVKHVCDIQPALIQPMATEDVDEVIWWRKWRAPRFTHMHPSGNAPYDESTAWTREDEATTADLLSGISKRFTEFVEIKLDEFVGAAHVETAKRGITVRLQPQGVPSAKRSLVAERIGAVESIDSLVFLCHASEDKAVVRIYASRLAEAGFGTWLDEEELLPGQEWDLEIRKAIRRSTAVIVFLSSKSEKRGYVQKEISRVLDEAERQPEGKIFLIPAKLEPCDVPERLSKWQWVDLSTINGFEMLCKALSAHRAKSSREIEARSTGDGSISNSKVNG